MNYNTHILPRANEELEDIYNWMSQHSELGAKKWRQLLFQQLDCIQTNPLMFGLAPENSLVESCEIRHCIFGSNKLRSYRIIYTVKEEDILILHVRSPDQDFVRDLKAN